jgi:hypothetical protein
MYAYSNNGQNMRAIEPGMEVPGEVVFDHLATEDELRVAFPGRAVAAQAQLQVALTDALQRHMDATAQSRGYDGIQSLCSYAGSSHPRFGPEGRAGLAWRDAVWSAGYLVVAEVQAGKRAVPTAEQVVAEMPEITWP